MQGPTGDDSPDGPQLRSAPAILQAVSSLFAHGSDKQEGDGGSWRRGDRASQLHCVTHLPIVPFANDFEEVEVCGPGAGGRGRNKVSICSMGKPGPEIKSGISFHFEGGEYGKLSKNQSPHH